jgi:hypothetical protein
MATKKAAVPQVTVLERRLQNPFGDSSPAVALKAPGWVVHVINTTLKPGRYHDVVRNKGWVPVLPEDLDGAAEDYGFDVRDGRIVRGERGHEVLMKMPATDYQQIQMAKDRVNRAQVSPRRMKAAVIEQAAGQYSDQAAAYLEQNVTIKTERAPIPLDDLDTPEKSA